MKSGMSDSDAPGNRIAIDPGNSDTPPHAYHRRAT
jgi:hypothetical protein